MESNDTNIILDVGTFFKENEKRLRLRLVSEKKSFDRQIKERCVHRPGLALAGFTDVFSYQRIQVCGNTEIAYLKTLSPQDREAVLNTVFSREIPCIIVTNRNRVPPGFVESANENGISVFTTSYPTTYTIRQIEEYIDEKHEPAATIHGTLMDVYGIGILITGRSGIGKSEVALDLVSRGHRLVADDVINTVRKGGGIILGKGNETLKYHMEIRGVGIIDVQSIYGIRAVRRQKRIEVQVELIDWDKSESHDRLGIDEMKNRILGEEIPLVRLPVYPGKTIAVIVEVIALNQLLKIYSQHSARVFTDRLTRKMQAKLRSLNKYLGHDYE